MNSARLAKRVLSLSEKLKDNEAGNIIHIDFNSFSEAEKLLFAKVDEIEEKYRQTGSTELLVENLDLILKNREVLFKRVTELYCYVVPMILGCYETKEIAEHFFKLYFYNFEADLSECLARVRGWSEKDRERFILDLKKNRPPLFRFPRGFNDLNDEREGDLNRSKDLGKQEEKEEK